MLILHVTIALVRSINIFPSIKRHKIFQLCEYQFLLSIVEQEAQNGGARISVSGQDRSDIMKRQISMGAKPSTIAEEAVDQLQENEKLVAGEA